MRTICMSSYYFVVDQNVAGQISVSWEDSKSVQEWLDGQPHQSWKQEFEEQGVLVSALYYYVNKHMKVLFDGFIVFHFW